MGDGELHHLRALAVRVGYASRRAQRDLERQGLPPNDMVFEHLDAALRLLGDCVRPQPWTALEANLKRCAPEPQRLVELLADLAQPGPPRSRGAPDDPLLEEARRQVELTMLGANLENIKEDADSRSELKSKVDSILGKFNW